MIMLQGRRRRAAGSAQRAAASPKAKHERSAHLIGAGREGRRELRLCMLCHDFKVRVHSCVDRAGRAVGGIGDGARGACRPGRARTAEQRDSVRGADQQRNRSG